MRERLLPYLAPSFAHKSLIINYMNKEDYKTTYLKQYADLMIEKIGQVQASEWQQPWFNNSFSGEAQNINGRKYSNINQIILSFVCEKYGYKTPVFITFKQSEKLGTRIKRGSKGFPVSFWSPIVTDNDGNTIPFEDYKLLPEVDQQNYTVKYYTKFYKVFNIEQTNFAEIQPDAWDQMLDRFSIEKHAQGDDYINPFLDKMIQDQSWVCPIHLKQQDSAFYNWKDDAITLPVFEQFPDKKEFYYTALHEMAHSTGHYSRLNRTFGQFGDNSYAREELVAELTSSFAGKQLGMNPLPRKENAQYLKAWLEQIGQNPEFLYQVLKDVNRSATMIEKTLATSSNLEVSNPELRPDILSLSKDEEGIIHASVMVEENITDVIVYPRGNEYCFTTGSLVDNNLQTHFLTPEENSKVIELLSYNPVKTITSARKTLCISGQTATIEYSGKQYDATEILRTLEKKGINVNNISNSQWENLLRGQGMQLNKASKSIFSITKTPAGYGIKVMSVAKNITKSANLESEP